MKNYKLETQRLERIKKDMAAQAKCLGGEGMNEQDQIKKLSEMIGNCILVGDSNEQIAEMALTMALHWNRDTKEAATEMRDFIGSLQLWRGE